MAERGEGIERGEGRERGRERQRQREPPLSIEFKAVDASHSLGQPDPGRVRTSSRSAPSLIPGGSAPHPGQPQA